MLGTYHISETVSKYNSQRAILVVGTFYYLTVLVMALCYMEAKFIMDGFSHIFQLANWEALSPSMGRHVLLLQQSVPFLFAKAGASIATIMLAYVVWDVVFYMLCFLVALFVLKDRLAALLMVSVHVFGMYYNHFMMVGELHPGSMFAVMALSVVRKWGHLNGVKRSILVPAAFFTVSSHPLALVGLFVSLFVWKVSDSVTDRGMKWGGLAILCFLMASLKVLLLDEYDENTIGGIIRKPTEAVQTLLSPSYLSDYAAYYLLSSPVVSLLSMVTLVWGIRRGMWRALGLWLLFLVFWSVVVQQYLDFSHFGFHMVNSMMHNRYLFPMKFVTLSLFILTVMPGLHRENCRQWWPGALMGLWFVGVPFLYISSFEANRTIDEFKTTIQAAREQGVTKAFFPVEDYCSDIYIHRNSYYATLVLSNLDGGPPCHVIHAPSRLATQLAELDANEILLMEGVVIEDDWLNDGRFSLSESAYQRLDYACSRERLGTE